MNPQQTQQLDKDVVNLAKAIRQVESGGNASARGASGEFGGYQFTPDTWKAYSSEAGLNIPFEQATLEHQNQVVYSKLKQWKDQGYNIGQVASMWNAGQGKPNAYMENHRGVNQFGVEYDTPGYAQKVAQAYQGIKGGNLGGTYTPPPSPQQFTPATSTGAETLQQQLGIEPNGLVGKVGQSITQGAQGVSSAYERAMTGQIGAGSGLLQGAGAAVGTVGDVVDDAITSIPVVGNIYEGATKIVGGALQGAAQASGLSDWYGKQSEETQGNIGAALEVASVIPFFKALKYGGKGLGDVKTAATLNSTKSGAVKELEASLNKSQRRVLDRSRSRGQDPMTLIVNNQEYLPDVIERNGKFYFDSKESAKAIQRDIDTDELALQNLLKSTISQKPGVNELSLNIRDIRDRTVKDVLGKAGLTGSYTGMKKAINDYFDALEDSLRAQSGREFISLPELNAIKRDIRSAINFDAVDPTGTLAKQAKFDAGQSLMKQVEEAAKKAGVKGVKELNQQMGERLTALDIIEHLGDGKVIKSGPSGLIKSVAKETPIVAGLVDYATRGIPSTATTRLKRKRPLRETGRRGLVQLGAGLGLSGQFQPEQEQ